MSDDAWTDSLGAGSAISFATIAALIGWDLAGDYAEGADWAHLAVELVVLLVAVTGAVVLARKLYLARGELRTLRGDLGHARQEAQHWKREGQELIRGLGAAIEQQFARWNLSRAEAEIGLMLLKGYSHKELARLRNTSERTVREQARAVYRKSGLGGRSELSAFFLEDLLLPQAGQLGGRDEASP